MKRLAFAAVFIIGGFAVVIAALASGIAVPSVNAAVLSTGKAGNPANGLFGGDVCADVAGGRIVPGTPITAFFCTAAPNQQFEFNGSTIFAVGGQGCVDVSGGRTAAGTPVQFWTCNGTGAQQWSYMNGAIINNQSNRCLDATGMENGRQLVINDCNGNISQNWQIK